MVSNYYHHIYFKTILWPKFLLSTFWLKMLKAILNTASKTKGNKFWFFNIRLKQTYFSLIFFVLLKCLLHLTCIKIFSTHTREQAKMIWKKCATISSTFIISLEGRLLSSYRCHSKIDLLDFFYSWSFAKLTKCYDSDSKHWNNVQPFSNIIWMSNEHKISLAFLSNIKTSLHKDLYSLHKK